MTVSTRTPEGFPSRCPLCGATTKIEFSDPTLDAPCPKCGQLLWLQSTLFASPQHRFAALVWISEPATPKTVLPRLELQTVSTAPQFSMRLLLVMLTTCALAFAILGAQTHDYLHAAAAMVIIFWIGTAFCFVGLVLDRHGDFWLAAASLAESIGLATIVIALFTGTYYGAMFVLAAVTLAVYS